MKLRCRTVLLSVGLLLLVGGTLSLPAVHWRLIGWWRGEAFFQGRPTSWWSRQLEREEPMLPLTLYYIHPSMGVRPTAPPRSWWQMWKEEYVSQSLLTGGDPAALPVLLELLRADRARVRLAAVYGLENFRSESDEAFQALGEVARSDADPRVRLAARLVYVSPDGWLNSAPTEPSHQGR